MQYPIDISTIPSPEDISEAKKAIVAIRKERKEALATPGNARLRVAQLEERLRAYNAWIAPIRRLNFDVLSRIFELVAEEDAMEPIRLRAVTRVWRDCILGMPILWSLVDFKRHRNPTFIDLCIERSRPSLLHMGLSPNSPYTTMLSIIPRLQCLSLYQFPPSIEGVLFPNLARLFIRSSEGSIKLSFITPSYFPALLHLDSRMPFVAEAKSGLYEDPNFALDIPPLRTLSLVVTRDWPWLAILRSCSSTLVSLRLQLSREPIFQRTRHQLTMSSLACLEISGHQIAANTWPLSLKTPALTTYIERVTIISNQELPHTDLATVMHMKIARLVLLDHCDNVRQLQLLNAEYLLYLILSRLGSDGALCPNLKSIEAIISSKFSLDEEDVNNRLDGLAKQRVPPQLHYRSQGSLPREITASCGRLMPCS